MCSWMVCGSMGGLVTTNRAFFFASDGHHGLPRAILVHLMAPEAKSCCAIHMFNTFDGLFRPSRMHRAGHVSTDDLFACYRTVMERVHARL